MFRNISAQAGPVFSKAFPARGLAVGDYNNDGRLEVLIGNNGGAPLLLKNNAAAGAHWIGVALMGEKCNRDAVGARVRWSVAGKVLTRLKSGGGSYLSSHDPRLVLGLGKGSQSRMDRGEVAGPERPYRTLHRPRYRPLSHLDRR